MHTKSVYLVSCCVLANTANKMNCIQFKYLFYMSFYTKSNNAVNSFSQKPIEIVTLKAITKTAQWQLKPITIILGSKWEFTNIAI